MNKVLFAGLALVAVAAIAYIGQNNFKQAASPDKAPTDVQTVAEVGESSCCGGCCGSEKAAEVPAGELASEKSECCGGCAESKLAAAATECPGTCAEGDGSKCCQSPKGEAVEDKTELVSETSEESETSSDSQ